MIKDAIKFTTLALIAMHHPFKVFCMEEVQLQPHSTQTMKPTRKTLMDGFNTGAQSSMEAGAYWKARAIVLAERNGSQKSQKSEKRISPCCGLIALFSS